MTPRPAIPGAVAIFLIGFPTYSSAMLRSLCLVLLLSSAGVSGAEEVPLSPAKQREVQLDSLFADLYRSDAANATNVASQIWDLWSKPSSATAEVLLAEASTAMSANEYETARTILDQLIKSYPDYAEAWNRRATLFFVTGKYDESLKDIDKVLELEPRHFGALAGRGLIYQKQQKWSEALSSFQQALKINPGMTDIRDAIRAIEKIERDI